MGRTLLLSTLGCAVLGAAVSTASRTAAQVGTIVKPSPKPLLKCADDLLLPLHPWSGIKAVTESLDPATAADWTAPVSLGAGPRNSILVQWTNVDGRGTLTGLSEAGVSRRVLSALGKASRGVALLQIDCGNYRYLLPNEPLMTMPPYPLAPEIQVRWGGYSDYSPGSEQAVLTPIAGNRAILVGKKNNWDSVSHVFTDSQPFAALIQLDGTNITYNAPPLDDDPDYWKGRRFPAPGPGFTVRAASPGLAGGLIFAGSYQAAAGAAGTLTSGYVYLLDTAYELAHIATFSAGLLPEITSVLQDRDGQIVVCGSTRASWFSSRAFVAKFDASLGALSMTSVQFGDSAVVGGCALTGDGSLIMSGSYSGTYAGHAAQARDVFLTRLAINPVGTPPSVTQFARFGSAQDEANISPPLVTGGAAFVAGVTAGTWGAASGTSPGKVFVLKVASDTFAAY